MTQNLSLIVTVIGGLAYLFIPDRPPSDAPRVRELARLAFAVGLLAYLVGK